MDNKILTGHLAKAPRSSWKAWLGVVPFFIFAILFLLLPSVRLFIGSFTDNSGKFTLENIIQLFTQKTILDAYKVMKRYCFRSMRQ